MKTHEIYYLRKKSTNCSWCAGCILRRRQVVKHVPVACSQQTLGPQLRSAGVLPGEFLRRLDLVLRAACHGTAGSSSRATLPRVGGSQQSTRYRLLVPEQPWVQDQTLLPFSSLLLTVELILFVIDTMEQIQCFLYESVQQYITIQYIKWLVTVPIYNQVPVLYYRKHCTFFESVDATVLLKHFWQRVIKIWSIIKY